VIHDAIRAADVALALDGGMWGFFTSKGSYGVLKKIEMRIPK
jgi:hypothetical protein